RRSRPGRLRMQFTDYVTVGHGRPAFFCAARMALCAIPDIAAIFLPRKHRQSWVIPAKVSSPCQFCTHFSKQLISCRSLALLFSRFFSFNRELIKLSIAAETSNG